MAADFGSAVFEPLVFGPLIVLLNLAAAIATCMYGGGSV